MTKVDVYKEPLTGAHTLPLEPVADYKERLPNPKSKVSIVYLAVDSKESIKAKLVRHERIGRLDFYGAIPRRMLRQHMSKEESTGHQLRWRCQKRPI